MEHSAKFPFCDESFVRQVYSVYRDHQSNSNWIYSEPQYDFLTEASKTFWNEFTLTVLSKARDASLLQKAKMGNASVSPPQTALNIPN